VQKKLVKLGFIAEMPTRITFKPLSEKLFGSKDLRESLRTGQLCLVKNIRQNQMHIAERFR